MNMRSPDSYGPRGSPYLAARQSQGRKVWKLSQVNLRCSTQRLRDDEFALVVAWLRLGVKYRMPGVKVQHRRNHQHNQRNASHSDNQSKLRFSVDAVLLFPHTTSDAVSGSGRRKKAFMSANVL